MTNLKNMLQRLLRLLFGSYRNAFFVFAFISLGLAYVVVRMHSIELDYVLNAQNKDIQKMILKNKEFKATKASLMSADRLGKVARNYQLSEPASQQIIVISTNP
jgi:Na+-translocating ferredoxin:NAD+ oxidoreductase RnfG subunit